MLHLLSQWFVLNQVLWAKQETRRYERRSGKPSFAHQLSQQDLMLLLQFHEAELIAVGILQRRCLAGMEAISSIWEGGLLPLDLGSSVFRFSSVVLPTQWAPLPFMWVSKVKFSDLGFFFHYKVFTQDETIWLTTLDILKKIAYVLA